MNENCCYNLTVDQSMCQNGISRSFTNTYTNVTTGKIIPLEFGYTMQFISGNNTNTTIRLQNEIFLPQTTFNIPVNSYRVFDLPCECGTYRLAVRTRIVPCACTTLCCNNEFV